MHPAAQYVHQQKRRRTSRVAVCKPASSSSDDGFGERRRSSIAPFCVGRQSYAEFLKDFVRRLKCDAYRSAGRYR